MGPVSPLNSPILFLSSHLLSMPSTLVFSSSDLGNPSHSCVWFIPYLCTLVYLFSGICRPIPSCSFLPLAEPRDAGEDPDRAAERPRAPVSDALRHGQGRAEFCRRRLQGNRQASHWKEDWCPWLAVNHGKTNNSTSSTWWFTSNYPVSWTTGTNGVE